MDTRINISIPAIYNFANLAVFPAKYFLQNKNISVKYIWVSDIRKVIRNICHLHLFALYVLTEKNIHYLFTVHDCYFKRCEFFSL